MTQTFAPLPRATIVLPDAPVTGPLVTPIDWSAGDRAIAQYFWTSTDKDSDAWTCDESEILRVLRFGMKAEPVPHGCYDSETEVLTSMGWVRWPEITGEEEFASLGPDGRIRYDRASRVVKAPYRGSMTKIALGHVDGLLTPGHRVYTQQRQSQGWGQPRLREVETLTTGAHRFQMAGGWWDGLGGTQPFGELLGFFLGDGSLTQRRTGLKFHLRKSRKIEFLQRVAQACGVSLTSSGDYYAVNTLPEWFQALVRLCYDDHGEKRIPREVLMGWSTTALTGVYRGLMASDGHVKPTGTETLSTTSHGLAGDVQELMLKLGRAAIIWPHPRGDRDTGFGKKPRYRVTLYRSGSLTPSTSKTRSERQEQVTQVDYDGTIHCVTVPYGTLYVRRNGKPRWCGNTPNGHGHLTVHVDRIPLPIAEQLLRHRVQIQYPDGDSMAWLEWAPNISKKSYRYVEAGQHLAEGDGHEQLFYVPPVDALLVQTGRPGAYTYEPVPADEATRIQAVFDRVYAASWEAYQELRATHNLAPERARFVLPTGLLTRMYLTTSYRNWFNWLVQRNDRHAQLEIRQVAVQVEEILKQCCPLTYDLWCSYGRRVI